MQWLYHVVPMRYMVELSQKFSLMTNAPPFSPKT